MKQACFHLASEASMNTSMWGEKKNVNHMLMCRSLVFQTFSHIQTVHTVMIRGVALIQMWCCVQYRSKGKDRNVQLGLDIQWGLCAAQLSPTPSM